MMPDTPPPADPKGRNNDVIADPAARTRLMFLLTSVIFFSVLNGTMFNVSIPDIAQQFDLLPSRVSWVLSGYVVLFAVSSVTYGSLGDIIAVRRLIVFGLLLFNAGSLLGFLSTRYWMLLAARAIQASGSGAIPALAMLIATRYFPYGEKGRVLGGIASTVAFAAGIGPILGGVITETLHWRFLFLLSLLTLLTIPWFRRYLPEIRRHGSRFDTAGAGLMLGGAGCLLLFITLMTWWLLPVGLAFMVVFVLHIRRVELPFLSPSLFRNREYRNMILVAFLSLGTVFGMLFMTPLMLRNANGLGTATIGLVMFPAAMTAAGAGRFGGRLVDTRGSVPVTYAGMAALAARFFLLSACAGMRPAVVSAALMFAYIGFSLLQSSLAHTVSAVLPSRYLGMGMGVYNLFFFMSGAFSAAFIGKALDVSRGAAPLNPFASAGAGAPYSNLFLLLSAVVLTALVLFSATIRSGVGAES